jgi:hypothetical protein
MRGRYRTLKTKQMKQILLLGFLIMSNLIYGQLLLSNADYYVYNNSMDTLHLTKIDFNTNKLLSTKSSQIFDTIQINGIGSKEIIFERSYSRNFRNIMQAHQEEEFTKIHKYEIWNIDTKTLLFEAISFYEFRFEYWSLLTNYATDNNNNNGWSRGICSYNYEFSIDSIGRIKINGTKTISTNKECIPDKEEGFYIFTNGQYKKE